MKYKLYTTSKKAWRGMINEIKKARKFIYIEMYIFIGDTSESHDFFSVLKERASAGVEVVVVADSLGSSDLKNSVVKDLRSSGVEFLFFSHWLRRTHRKILVIDGRVSFLGGVNIKKHMMNWIDIQVRIISPMMAKNIIRSFAYTYQMSGGKKEHILQKRKVSVFKTIRSQFLEHFPNNNIYSLETKYQEKMISAKKKIVIVTPYFTPPRWLMALFETVIDNGVKVEIFIPQNTDVKFLNRVNRAYINKLSYLGIDFYYQSKMNHAKILVIDDEEALVGSQNLDVIFFRMNLESGIFIKNKQFLKELDEVIDGWRRGAVKFVGDKSKISFFDKIILAVIKVFYSML